MKILVTGGAGFIGSHIVDELLGAGHRVVIVDNFATGDTRNVNPKAKLYRMDIGSPNLDFVFKKEKIDAVCHVAAKTNMRETMHDPLKDIEINVVGMVKLLECAKKHKVKKFVFSSTGGALYGNTKVLPTTEDTPTNPISPYGIDKLTGEKYCSYYHHLYGIPVVILRYSNVYGPRLERKKGGASATMKIIQTMHKGERPTITGDGNQTRDFIYVKDVARANRLALTQRKKGCFVYNVASGTEISINNLVSFLGGEMETKSRPRYGKAIRGEVTRSVLSNRKALRDLRWKPAHDLKRGIRETLAYLRFG